MDSFCRFGRIGGPDAVGSDDMGAYEAVFVDPPKTLYPRSTNTHTCTFDAPTSCPRSMRKLATSRIGGPRNEMELVFSSFFSPSVRVKKNFFIRVEAKSWTIHSISWLFYLIDVCLVRAGALIFP